MLEDQTASQIYTNSPLSKHGLLDFFVCLGFLSLLKVIYFQFRQVHMATGSSQTNSSQL